jgi:hypothetical protein
MVMPSLGAAIFLGDDAVLRHVDETAGQVARVRGLQRGVGEALTGAVGRVEVLENVRPSLKFEMIGVSMISPDGLAIRPRMPASCFIWPANRARPSGHHVDRVDRLLAAVLRLLTARFGHHLVGDLVGALGPGVDDLVVLLALGDQAVVVLLLVLLRPACGCLDDLSFASGMTMSSLPNEMPALQACLKPSAMMRSQKITVSF